MKNEQLFDFKDKATILTIAVAALGYFVDIYDLLLFGIVRIQSLKDMGVQDFAKVGSLLMDYQMIGLLIGGILWGILGDKKGRLSVLMGSILMYSLANIANGFVTTLEAYKWLRFIAGIGLAGELGAGITLVSEMMSKEKRAYGTSIVAGIGILGAVAAYFVSITWDWRTAYFVGGGMGLMLLLLRVSLHESGFFKQVVQSKIKRGNFLALFSNSRMLKKYFWCSIVGFMIWYVIGILVTLAPEICREAYGMTEKIDNGKAIMWCYSGSAIGDFLSGVISQWFKSRKKALLFFLILSIVSIVWYFMSDSTTSADLMYLKIAFIGFGVGYWALFVSVASEHFGTNLRATVTTTVPNYARAFLVPVSMTYHYFKGSQGILQTLIYLAIFCACLAFIGIYNIEETYGKDLDFIEE